MTDACHAPYECAIHVSLHLFLCNLQVGPQECVVIFFLPVAGTWQVHN